MSTPVSSTLRGDDLDFQVLTWGEDSGPLALLLHGYPDSPHSWTAVAERLAAAGYRVAAPWTRGYAPTDVPPDGSFHIGALAYDAVALHRALGGDDRAVLVGHDWGAVAAHAVAGNHSQPFRRVVTMSVPPARAFLDRSDGWWPWIRRCGRQVRWSWYMAFQQLPWLSERSLERLVPVLWRHWSPAHQPGPELDAAWDAIGSRRTEVLRYYRHTARWWTVPQRYRAAQSGLWRSPTVPMLYLHGREDGCMLPDWSGPTARVLPPRSRVEMVPGAGHFLQVERPELVAELILDFLGSAEAPATSTER